MGDNLSEVQALGVEYLQYADGLEETRRRTREAEQHTALLNTLVRAALVSSGGYEEKSVFAEYFPTPDLSDDADADLDYADVDFGIPDESEIEILQRMLADDSVTVSGMNGSEESQAAPDLPAPREIALGDIEQDREWV